LYTDGRTLVQRIVGQLAAQDSDGNVAQRRGDKIIGADIRRGG